MPRVMVAAAVVSMLIGCARAPKSTLDVTQPEPYVVENERFYPLPFDDVWKSLVAELSKSFFVINNIEKESNLINLSFSAKDPEGYMDCGISTWTFKGERFSYPIAGDGFYKTAQQAGANAFYVYSVQRETDVEGRINVYVAPEEGGTNVTVNVRYILTVSKSGSAEAIGGALQISHGHQAIPKETSTITFNTNQEGTVTFNTNNEGGQDRITCVSNGRLETMILDMVGE